MRKCKEEREGREQGVREGREREGREREGREREGREREGREPTYNCDSKMALVKTPPQLTFLIPMKKIHTTLQFYSPEWLDRDVQLWRTLNSYSRKKIRTFIRGTSI